MASKSFVLFVLAVISLSTASLVMFEAARAADVPPVYGIELYDYEHELHQEAGTASVHVVRVRNTGVLELAGIELSAGRLPTAIFKAGTANKTILKFGETADITYSLDVPDGFDGTYAFSVIATASYGVGNVSHSKAVQLVVSPGGAAANTTTTTTAACQITLPDTGPVRPDVAAIGGRFAELAGVPLSKFRVGVEYVRSGAASVISDEMLLSTVAAALFVIMLFLIAVQNALYKAKHNG
ncbi:MAG: hypothetical protein NT016_00770 [Candidatus Aenigmarchaeota archaeon]|nr:hypothetical protein [Candidatus Aenigmarchaeota archaeon]